MASFDCSLNGLNKFLATTAGRDKIGKFVHYGARGVAGYAADVQKASQKDSVEYAKAAFVNEKARALFVRIMNARRTVRWLSFIPVIIALRKKDYPWNNRTAFMVSQSAFAWWIIVDHVRWLQQINWLPGDQARSKRISFTGFVLSSTVALAYFLSELRNEKQEDDKEKRTKLRLTVLKHLVTVISTLHISELFPTSEIICGACGAIASAVDIYLTFPRVEKINNKPKVN